MRLPAAGAPRVGETLAVSVDIDRLYLFDGDGDRIDLPTDAPLTGRARPA